MADLHIWTPVLTSLGTTALVIFTLLALPTFRAALARYIASFMQHHFDQRIERLKSELRQTEDAFRANLKTSENRLNSLTETALSLRSARQVALDARRLQAVERLWAAKIGIDRWKMAAYIVSILNFDELLKEAERGNRDVAEFAGAIDKMTGVTIDKDTVLPSALSERPFLPANVWTLFSAYQGVIVFSVMQLKVLATGAGRYWKKEDVQKPIMLAALPEYQSYIEQYGQSGYYHLLDILEQKLLNALSEMLDGKDHHIAAVKGINEIASLVGQLNSNIEIPESLRMPEAPRPPGVQ